MNARQHSRSARDALRGAGVWIAKANCVGMQSAFTDATHEEQREVCYGTNNGGRTCPVMQECLDDLILRVEMFGIQEVNDGNLVCGGMTPKMIRRMFREIKEQSGVQAAQRSVE